MSESEGKTLVVTAAARRRILDRAMQLSLEISWMLHGAQLHCTTDRRTTEEKAAQIIAARILWDQISRQCRDSSPAARENLVAAVRVARQLTDLGEKGGSEP